MKAILLGVVRECFMLIILFAGVEYLFGRMGLFSMGRSVFMWALIILLISCVIKVMIVALDDYKKKATSNLIFVLVLVFLFSGLTNMIFRLSGHDPGFVLIFGCTVGGWLGMWKAGLLEKK